MTDKASEAMAWLKMASEGSGWICPCGMEDQSSAAVSYEHAVKLHEVVRALEVEVADLKKRVAEAERWNDPEVQEYYIRLENAAIKEASRAKRAEARLADLLKSLETKEGIEFYMRAYLSRGPDGRDSGEDNSGGPPVRADTKGGPVASAAANFVGVAPDTADAIFEKSLASARALLFPEKARRRGRAEDTECGP